MWRITVLHETTCSQLLDLLKRCAQLNTDVRFNMEQRYFTVLFPPPWNYSRQCEAQAIQEKIKEWSKQYPHVVCYCFDSYSTLLYVL